MRENLEFSFYYYFLSIPRDHSAGSRTQMPGHLPGSGGTRSARGETGQGPGQVALGGKLPVARAGPRGAQGRMLGSAPRRPGGSVLHFPTPRALPKPGTRGSCESSS